MLLTGLVAVSLTAWLGIRVFARYPTPPVPLAILNRGEYALVVAAADASFPRGGAIEPSGTDAEIPSYVDRYLSGLPPRTGRLVRMLFFLLEHATLLFPPRGWRSLRRFSKLSPETQVAYLEGWQDSGFFVRRLVFTSLRSILTLGYFSHPGVLNRLGLSPKQIRTPVSEADLLWPAMGQHPDQIRYTREDLTPPSDGSPLDPAEPVHPDYETRAP